MAIAASTFDDAPTERQPGQLRRSRQGTPYVADPSGDGLVQEHQRMLTGGFYAEVTLTYDATIADELRAVTGPLEFFDQVLG